MPSFRELLNPTFFMFLGILLLAIGLLVIYIENKIREQNHKISSMLSLVSSLAEEVRSAGSCNNAMSNQSTNDLISVSDGDDEESLESLYESDDSVSDDSDDDDSDGDDDKQHTTVKILKLNLFKDDSLFNKESVEILDDSQSNDLDSEVDDSEVDDSEVDDSDINDEIVPKVEDSIFDLKSINISSLEELTTTQSIDYKKLNVNKLRDIVMEKGLTTEPSKLKKAELLKLLGTE